MTELDRPGGEGSHLVMRSLPEGEPIVVARFPARAEFAYLDEKGVVHSSWPALSPTGRARKALLLPSSLEVRSLSDQAVLAVFPISAAGFRQTKPGDPLFKAP